MRTCQYCGRPNLTTTDEVCNGCGGNLPADGVIDKWRQGFVDKKYEELTFDPYERNREISALVTTSSTSVADLIYRVVNHRV